MSSFPSNTSKNIYSLPSITFSNLATLQIDVSPLLNYEGERKITDKIIENNQQRMFISFIINTLATLFVLFIILKHSPKNMGIYKYLLANISIWSYVLDFVLTLLWMPLPMMPAPSICITGILKNLGQYNGNGISFISFMFTFGGCNVSCFTAQLYRIYSATARDTSIFSRRWFIFVTILCHCMASSPGIIGYFFTVELDNDSLIRYQITNFPFMKSVVWKLPCGGFIVDETHKNFLYFFLTVFACVSIGIILNAVMLTYLLLSLKESFKNSVSLGNAQLQRQLVTVLVVQTLLPTICLCIPYSFVILSALTYSPFLSSFVNVLISIGSLHSFFHTLVLIFMIKPYKTAVVAMIWKCRNFKNKNCSAAVSANTRPQNNNNNPNINGSLVTVKSMF